MFSHHNRLWKRVKEARIDGDERASTLPLDERGGFLLAQKDARAITRAIRTRPSGVWRAPLQEPLLRRAPDFGFQLVRASGWYTQNGSSAR